MIAAIRSFTLPSLLLLTSNGRVALAPIPPRGDELAAAPKGPTKGEDRFSAELTLWGPVTEVPLPMVFRNSVGVFRGLESANVAEPVLGTGHRGALDRLVLYRLDLELDAAVARHVIRRVVREERVARGAADRVEAVPFDAVAREPVDNGDGDGSQPT